MVRSTRKTRSSRQFETRSYARSPVDLVSSLFADTHHENCSSFSTQRFVSTTPVGCGRAERRRGSLLRGFRVRSSLRRVRGTRERRCGRLHELARVRLHVPAGVQRRLHGIRDELVLRGHAHRGDVLRGQRRGVHSDRRRLGRRRGSALPLN